MEMYSEDRFERLENKLTEIRKLSLGTLLLAKEIWKNKLRQEEADIVKIIEEAEDTFIDSSLMDRFERFENTIDVINKRMKGLFLVLEDIVKSQ